ncbi:MAG: Ig-like domain-containing protein, partial [Acidobacteria bacterium]|nr:Ig-like domain-containing protein [Acidobacteriota bacterium]
SRIVFGAPASVPAPVPTTITLIVSPAEAAVGYRTRFQALITAAGVPVTEGTVDFTVDSSGAGRVALDRRGIAATSFATHIAGTYDVRARFLGTARYESSTINRTLTVRSR